ncbi:MAG TPA: DUF4382 domain-containing protein, partial [Acidobacteriota bacterium]|nr:DUF4382 domain-containing protein [Acidobacteriota bacterium]
MTRLTRIILTLLLVVAGAAGFGLVTSCNIMGGGSNATGGLNLFLTDAPTDEWEQVTVVLKSISLHRNGSKTWESVWTADPANPASGTVNLVDLNAVAELLKQSATIPVGTYDRMMIVINTDPTTMTLIPDGSTTPIPAANITVVDPGGKGEIKIDLDPAIVVEEGKDANLMVDFDLAHPLSIVNVDGKVVLSLKVRHRALPRHLNQIQFARTIGNITAAATDLTNFTIKTLHDTDVTFKVSTNTIYYDVDNKTTGSFSGLSGLVGTGAALVASNMNADGSLFARRVWYATKIELLPQFTPEGLVRRVGDTWLSILKKNTETMPTGDDHHRCEWNTETVFVDAGTKWTFQDIEMGTGIEVLRFIARGFRVEVTYQNVDVYPHVAATINVRSAHAEGLIVNPTLESFGLGWWRHIRTMFYSGVTDHTFGWWFYGEDYARSTDIQGLIDAVGQAQQARLWVFAWAGLYWDQIAGRWAVENLVLAPLKLHDFSKITTGYTAESGSMIVSTYDCWDEATPTDMTVKLDQAGDLQTVVGSFVWNSQTNVMTFTLPVAPDRWPNVLTPDVSRVKIWVRPVKVDTTWSWHAYTVLAYTFV